MNIDIESFYNALNPKQQQYFLMHTPIQIVNWYKGEYAGAQKSDKLVLSKEYLSLDSLAVCFSYLGKLAPLKLPEYLYRTTRVKRYPSSYIVTLNKNGQLKPLLSFTALEDPLVIDQYSENKDHEIILEWENPTLKNVLTGTEQLTKIAKAILVFLKTKGIKGHQWNYALSTLKEFEEEEEFIIYLNSPIKCTWSEL